MRKIWAMCLAFWLCMPFAWAVDASELLPPEQAFVPQVYVSDEGLNVQFRIADGYYLYQSKLEAQTDPENLLGTAQYSVGEEKEDDFFGKQIVYHHAAQAVWRYQQVGEKKHRLVLSYQGCAEVGVCYPPAQVEWDIQGNGVYQAPFDVPDAKGVNRFLETESKPQSSVPSAPDSSRFTLSWNNLNANLLAFFLAGLGLSFTACMYPLIPIVSSIVVGDKGVSKGRAGLLTFVYTQGLALTYTFVGIFAGLTGSLLTVWLQQAWVVWLAAMVMVLLALSMFGVFSIQLPVAMQSYFQSQSSRLTGGKVLSVFVMGVFSALIVGPCVAPPLAFALGYIGQTGDAVLGGLALYALALGMGVPLMVIGVFGGHILPKAGNWMNGVKYAFGFILLAVAVYLLTAFLPFALVAGAYVLLLIVPAVCLAYQAYHQQKHIRHICVILSALLLLGGVWFGVQSVRGESTALHHFLTLYPHSNQAATQQKYTSVAELKTAMQTAWKQQPNAPVLLDFYADWCVSCKEMEAYTLNQAEVWAVIPKERFFTIDVTQNTAEHQALLKEYGLFGPPGIFVLHADGKRSEALLGFVKPDAFIQWYQNNQSNHSDK